MTFLRKTTIGTGIFILSSLFAYEADAQVESQTSQQNIKQNDPVNAAEEKLIVVKFGDGTDAQDYSLETGSTVMLFP